MWLLSPEIFTGVIGPSPLKAAAELLRISFHPCLDQHPLKLGQSQF